MPADKRMRVLQDLSMGMLGYSGIPQDTRLMFKTFSRLKDVNVTGLLSEMGPGFTRRISTKRMPAKQRGVFNGSMFLLGVSGVETDRVGGTRLSRLKRRVLSLGEPFTSYGVAPLDFDSLDDAIWRLFFDKTLEAADREHILAQKFALTNLNFVTFLRRFQSSMFTPPKLDTRGYNFLVTSEPRPIRVSRGTRHIARFHDAIPITDADMFDNVDVVNTAFNMVYRSSPTAIFSCVSQPSEEALLRIFPQLKGRTTTIPNALPEVTPANATILPVSEIVRARASSASWGNEAERSSLREAALGKLSADKPFRYILAVSTIEPRKNFTSVVRAWERVRYQNDTDVKLVVVGRPGWRFEPTLAAMRPRILEGSLLHLQDVTNVELQALYANAECLVSPSFAEGFGFPPLEAMQWGTPAIVSDIPAHRWALGDAALFIDPYSVPDIARKITQLVVADDRDSLRRELHAKAARILARYAPDRVGEQWAELFARLKRGEGPASSGARDADVRTGNLPQSQAAAE
jgi:glycosyltransferase involved in cell wall biosynthesis